jgi:HAD superfamily 5'-nucleotidase-like hydrolase
LQARPLRPRGVFCNRTLNLRSIRAIGYDLDYTLVHYNVAAWEERAYDHSRDNLAKRGWPIEHLRFDREMIVRGLVIDKELGNLVKANRFGFVKKAVHGTRTLGFDEQRAAYARTPVDLSEERWVFLNTLFSLSEGCLYAQLTDLLDSGALPGPLGYRQLYERVRDSLDATHVEGELKAEVLAEPERFIEDDPETALTLLDQKHAGKKLILITNSDWAYANAMMNRAVGRFLPPGMPWRELFHLVIVGAKKPEFFTSHAPDELLYVGDHMFGDVHVSKRALRWRTALVLRELEEEIRALEAFRPTEERLVSIMDEKERMEAVMAETRLRLQRKRKGYGPPVPEGDDDERTLEATLDQLRQRIAALDAVSAPMAQRSSELTNERWGLLLRAGNDKSHLARQVERYADIYTSRVSNLLSVTPFVYLRSPRGSLPHDPAVMPDDRSG